LVRSQMSEGRTWVRLPRESSHLNASKVKTEWL
jgi:hypothetical protein